MLHANLPQSLGCSVVQQLETDGGFKLVKLGTGRDTVVSVQLVLLVQLSADGLSEPSSTSRGV